MKKLIGLASVLVLVTILVTSMTSCGPATYAGVDLSVVGTPPAGISGSSLLARALADPVGLTVYDTAGAEVGTINITEALISLKDVQLEMKDSEVVGAAEEEQELEVEFVGPYLVDLLKNTVTPPLGEIALLPGTYDDFSFSISKVEAPEDGSEPLVDSSDPLFGNSIYLSGTYTDIADSSTSVPFTLTFDLDEEFDLTPPGDTSEGFVIDEQTVSSIIVAFRLARWFDFSNSETNSDEFEFTNYALTNGEIVLDKDSEGVNQSIRAVIKDNIKMSADYGEDEDGDGELGSDEDDDPDTEDADDY